MEFIDGWTSQTALTLKMLMSSNLHLVNSLFWFHHAQYCKQTIGSILKSNWECRYGILGTKVSVFPLCAVTGVPIFYHLPFSSSQPHLQLLLLRELCLLQYHHLLCFILPLSMKAPSFPVLRHSQVLNYTMPNQLFRVSTRLKGAVSSIRPINPIALSITVISHWIFPPLNASSQAPKLNTDPENSCHNTADDFMSDADSSQILYVEYSRIYLSKQA